MIAGLVVGAAIVLLLLLLRLGGARQGRGERMSEAWLDEHAGSRDK